MKGIRGRCLFFFFLSVIVPLLAVIQVCDLLMGVMVGCRRMVYDDVNI